MIFIKCEISRFCVELRSDNSDFFSALVEKIEIYMEYVKK